MYRKSQFKGSTVGGRSHLELIEIGSAR